MTARALMILVLLVAAPACRAAFRVERRTYPVQPGCSFKIDTYRGDVEIGQSDDSQVHLEIRLTTATEVPAESKRVFDRLKLGFKAENNSVSVLVRNPEETRYSFDWNDRLRLGLSFSVRVPPGTVIDATTANGEISTDNLTGPIDARTKLGDIVLRRIDGAVHASAEHGDIIMSRCTGSATLKTLLGGIRVGTIFGRADLHSVDGDIELQHAVSDLSVVAEVGDVIVGFSKDISHEARISTDGGAITVRLDPEARCDIQASSVWGRVHTTLPIAVSAGGNGQRRLTGRLNGGGPLLTFHANGGQVHLDPPRN